MADKELSFKISIEGVSLEAEELAKIEYQLRNIKKEKQELDKLAAKGFLSNEDRAKLAAYNKEIEEQTKRQKELKKVMDSAPDSLNRMRAELIRLKDTYASVGAEARDKMAPAIKKLNDEISKSEQAIGVHQRNVGNYPKIAGEAGGAMQQLSSSIGGVAGETGNLISSFLTAGGPLGILTAGVAALAKAWKTTQENIKLYLASADKIMIGAGAFEQDAETARKEARKRGEGQLAEGLRLAGEYQVRLMKGGESLSQETRDYYNSIIASGVEMQKNGRQIITDTYGIQNKIEWERKYSALLMEEERLSDEKLEKETQWEELESNLIKQRAIVSSQETTSAQKKQAAIDADIIANKLVKEKTDFVTREYDNLVAISNMTGLQEVNEDRINALLKQRNSIQKEYYADQVKINRLQRASGGFIAGIIGELDVNGVDQNTLIEQAQAATDAALDSKQAFLDKKKEMEDAAWDEGMKKAYENYDAQKAAANKNAQDLLEIDLAKLDAKAEIRDAEIAIAAGIGSTLTQLAGKNRGLAMAGISIEKGAAVAQIISNIAVANAKAIARSPLTAGMPWTAINTVLGAVSIANVVAQAARSISEVQKFATGGRITGGLPINTGTKDNLLIAVHRDEAVLNPRQIAALGGSGAMRRARVPGFADGGAVSPVAQSPNANINDNFDMLSGRMSQMEVVLNVNKLNSAQNELNVINQTSRI